MPYRRFAIFNFTGAVLWAIGVTLAGYLLGQIIPAEVLDRYLYLIIAVVIGLSILPTVIHLYRENREEVHARIRSRGRQGAAASRPFPDEPSA
jgi:membrane-associated protein